MRGGRQLVYTSRPSDTFFLFFLIPRKPCEAGVSHFSGQVTPQRSRRRAVVGGDRRGGDSSGSALLSHSTYCVFFFLTFFVFVFFARIFA